ncbi:MAG: alpha/beta fold hydrolase [Methylohalobius sp.]
MYRLRPCLSLPRMIAEEVLTLPTGRRIGFARYGDPKGQPVFYCHGLPSSRLEAKLVAATARRLKIHLIALDRPGYGYSDPLPPMRIADWPEDLERLADHLQLERCSVLGISGGGPYALACGWRLRARVLALGLVCALGPVARVELRRGMSPAARWAFFLAQNAPWALKLFFGNPTARFLRRFPDFTFALLMRHLPEKDRLTLADLQIRQVFRATICEGLRHGAAGALRDFVQYVRPWGVELAAIDLPVALWHGDADTVVPLTHARYLAERLPKAKLHVLPKEGHYSLPAGYAEAIFADIVQICRSS